MKLENDNTYFIEKRLKPSKKFYWINAIPLRKKSVIYFLFQVCKFPVVLLKLNIKFVLICTDIIRGKEI